MSIRDNILKIKEEIGDEAKLVAVSKTRSTKEINDAYNSGQKIFGENRVQEAKLKYYKSNVLIKNGSCVKNKHQ